ncbi:cbb3-type cytochrome c oxidase subunit 3 [Pseudoroseicyclus sp. H15]
MHETYTLLREIADSWVLLAMTAFFVGCCLWAFRPGSRAIHADAADAIFREPEGDRPAAKPTKSGI